MTKSAETEPDEAPEEEVDSNLKFAHAYSPIGSYRHTFDRRYVSLSHLLNDFCFRTSSHGIPHIAESVTLGGKVFWILVCFACSVAFLYQTYFTVARFLEYSTIMEMELRFEAAPFPAVTVCNLNPYKSSKLKDILQLQQALDQFEEAISKPKSERNESFVELFDSRNYSQHEHNTSEPLLRTKRMVYFQPIYVSCTCHSPEEECMPIRNPSQQGPSACMCFENSLTGDTWPCYVISAWTEELCDNCSVSNSCPHPRFRSNDTGQLVTPCWCQRVSNFCMVKPEQAVKWWKPSQYVTTKVVATSQPQTPSAEVLEAFGVNTVKDTGSITVKSRETIILLAAALDMRVRTNLSYSLWELVFSCTFNMADCDLDRDFRRHMDPVFGNCFTYNYNKSATKRNSRAGPLYGLRLLLNVNQSDYLSVTESAGIRLVVHDPADQPFPDTFGYSAPVGAISSFGLKTKKVSRLGMPYGTCIEGFRPDNYIYDEFYSTEGCYRTCFQHRIISHCNCSDPRYPGYPHIPVCRAYNPDDRECLKLAARAATGLYTQCTCVQRCNETLWETSYSASAWPASNYKTGECPPEVTVNDTEACREYFRSNTAFIEIFYEQLNYESLREAEAYSIVNLLSDFGGNIGLWIGFSAITMIEFIELVMEMMFLCYQRRKETKRRKLIRKCCEMTYANKTSESPDVRSTRRLIIPKIRSPTNLPVNSL